VFLLLLMASIDCRSLFAEPQWISLRSKSLTAISSAGESRSRRLLLKLEQFRSVFFDLFGFSEARSAPLTVVIFKDKPSFQPYATREGIGGFYSRGRSRDLIAINADVGDPFELIFHEYTHRLTAYTAQPWPVWLDEGMAEFYSTFSISGRNVTIGKPIGHHVLLLQQTDLLPLAELLAVGPQSPQLEERERRGIFYAQSWAFVHYLMVGNKGNPRPKLVQYCGLLDSGKDPLEAFKSVFSLAELDKELDSYIRNRRYDVYHYKLAEAPGKEAVLTRSLGRAEALLQLGDLMMETGRLTEARKHFLQSVSLDPDLTASYQRLATIAQEQEDWESSKHYLQKAVLRDSADYLTHYLYAENLMNAALHQDRDSGAVDGQTFEKILRHLQRAAELMPSFPDSYHLIGRLCLSSGRDPQEGIRRVKNALQLKPQSNEFRLTLAELQILAGDDAGARATITGLAAARMNSDSEAHAKRLLRRIGVGVEGELVAEMGVDAETRADTDQGEVLRSPDSEPIANANAKADRPACKPSFADVQDAARTSGRILSLECGEETAYLVDVDGIVKRFLHLDPEEPVIFSCVVQLTNLKCGPFEQNALVYYRPMAEDSGYAGAAIAIELRY
jgi:tetratricopeptide (TPR) repeat protein